MKSNWLGGLALTALLAVSCGPLHGTANSPSTASASRSTPVVTAFPAPSTYPAPTTASSARTGQCQADQPAPQFSPSAPSNRNLALVSLKGSNDFVVRDVTDINHPFTVSSLGNQVAYSAQFVSATELSDGLGNEGLFRIPLSGSPKTVVAACGTRLFAWTLDGTEAAYISGSADPQVELLHVVRGGRDSVVDSVRNPMQGGFGCESRSSCETWSFRLMYSPSGAFITLVQLPGPGLRIWTSNGKLLKSVESSLATMPVWSGAGFYWLDDKGVETWRDGSQSLMLPGVTWLNPHASPIGGLITYQVRDAGDTTAHVYLLDVATGKTREIAQSRSYPAFLTSRYLWYQGERPCQEVACIDATTTTGTTFIYDLQTGTEYQSIIAHVWDVWPHPA
jgi:hypothetical protein